MQLAQMGIESGNVENQLRLQDLNALYQEWQRQQPWSSPVFQSALQYGMGIPGATAPPTTPWGSIISGGAKIAAAKIPFGCFSGSTKVQMEDGSDKSIEDVKLGDTLMGQNGEIRKVSQVFTYPESLIDFCLNGIEMKDHPVYLQFGELKMVSDINFLEPLWNGIEAIVKDSGDIKVTVYNLGFTFGHDFFVMSEDGWLRVHNGREV